MPKLNDPYPTLTKEEAIAFLQDLFYVLKKHKVKIESEHEFDLNKSLLSFHFWDRTMPDDLDFQETVYHE